MNETELLEQLYSSGGMVWDLLQYWTSVSFGILIASHLAAKRLHWFVLIAFVVLYTLFTLNLLNLVRVQVGGIVAIGNDLQVLADKGVVLSHLARNFLEASPLVNQTATDQILRQFMAGGMYVTTVAYAVYCRIKPGD